MSSNNFFKVLRIPHWWYFIPAVLAPYSDIATIRSQWPLLLLGSIAAAFGLAAAYSLNNLMDYRFDDDLTKNPITSKSKVTSLVFLLFLIPLGIALTSSTIVMVAISLQLLGGLLYSAVVRLKQYPIIGTITNILIFCPLLFFAVPPGADLQGPILLAFIFAGMLVQNQLIHEQIDIEEDRGAGVRSTAMLLGRKGYLAALVFTGSWTTIGMIIGWLRFGSSSLLVLLSLSLLLLFPVLTVRNLGNRDRLKLLRAYQRISGLAMAALFYLVTFFNLSSLVTDLFNQLTVAGLLLLILVGLATCLLKEREAILASLRESWLMLAIVLAVTSALIIMATALMEPWFIHSHYYGVKFLSEYFHFPSTAQLRPEYGQAGYLMLGALATIFGKTLSTVALCNLFFLMAGLVFLGVAAAIITGHRSAVVLALLTGGTSAVILRAGYSEDVHAIAMFWGALALLGMTAAVKYRKHHPLLMGGAALLLGMHTRQIMFFWPLAVLGGVHLAASRERMRGQFDNIYAAAILLPSALLVIPILLNVGKSNNLWDTAASAADFFLFEPHLYIDLLRKSVFTLNRDISLLLFPIALIGMLSSGKRVLVFIPGALVLFAASLANWHADNFGDRYSMSLPFTFIIIFFSAIWLSKLLRRRRILAAVLIGAVVLTNLISLVRISNLKNPLNEEYRYLQSIARKFPRDSVIVYRSMPEKDLRTYFPGFLFERHGVRVIENTGGALPDQCSGSMFFYKGISCSAYAPMDMYPVKHSMQAPQLIKYPEELRRHWGRGDGRPPVSIPRSIRRECAAVIRPGSKPLHSATIDTQRNDPPYIFYNARSVKVGFYQLCK